MSVTNVNEDGHDGLTRSALGWLSQGRLMKCAKGVQPLAKKSPRLTYSSGKVNRVAVRCASCQQCSPRGGDEFRTRQSYQIYV